MEAIDSVAFSRLQWAEYSESLYNDRLISNYWLNECLIFLNNAFGRAFTNLASLSLMGNKTAAWRQFYLDFTQRFTRSVGHQTGSIRDQTGNAREEPRTMGSSRRIKLGTRSNFLFAFALVAQLFFGLRYVYFLFISSRFGTYLAKFTSAKSLTGLNHEPVAESTTGEDLLEELGGLSSASENHCAHLDGNRFAGFLAERYGGFRFWNQSVGVNARHNAFLLNWITVEMDGSLQMFTQEIDMLVLVVGMFTLFCGLAGGLTNLIKPYDVPALTFVWFPDFAAFRLNARLNFYLHSIRTSYVNFWSRRQVDSRGRLSYSDTGSRRRHQLVVDNISLSHQHFRTYLPTVRGQNWRSILAILQPLLWIFAVLVVVSSAMGIFFYHVHSTRSIVLLNKEIKLTLEEADQRELEHLEGLMAPNSCDQLEIQKQFKAMLVGGLGRIMSRLKYSQKFHNGSYLAQSISPIEEFKPIRWLVVWLSTFNIGFLAGIYVVVYYLQICDLCLWLAEIQMKLTVSGLILRHYQSRGGLNYISHLKQLQDVKTTTSEMNQNYSMSLWEIFQCLFASWANKMAQCERHARRLIELDKRSRTAQAPRRQSDQFLVSTYLDVRLFQDEIDLCRTSINYLISFLVFEALNILIGASWLKDVTIRFGLVAFCFLILNLILMAASFFQSQCRKLHNPIHSILAASVRGDKRAHHLALLWRRYLLDLTGSHSKFAFKVYSITISYATTLQFSFSLASVFILTVDARARH